MLNNTTPNTNEETFLIFYSQAEIQKTLDGCTTVIDDINIPYNYTDVTVDLSGIKELKGYLVVDGNLRNLVLPDMERMGGLSQLIPVTHDRYEVPKLRSIDFLKISGYASHIDLPSLVSVGRLQLSESMKKRVQIMLHQREV